MELINTFEYLDISNSDSEGSKRSGRGGKRSGSDNSILGVLRNEKRFSMLLELIEKAGKNLEDDLDRKEVTLFAPTNDALKKFHELCKGGEGRDRYGRRYSDFKRGDRDRDVDMPSMEDILKYHIVNEEVSIRDLVDGELLKTELREKALDGKQRIHVVRRLGGIYLNMIVHVSEMELKAQNGYVHPIDFVLLPPPDAFRVIFNLPFIAGTFASAVQYCEIDRELMEKKDSLTVLLPVDAAWKEMNFGDLIYLFSPIGRKDLMKILEYHIITDQEYLVEMIKEKKEITLPTMLKNEEVVIKVFPMEKKGRGGDRQRDSRRKSWKNIESINDYMVVVNSGEATVKYSDIVARNGNVLLINSVLIPESVCLPSRRLGQGSKSSGYEGGFEYPLL